jgi:lipopolysaccharide/colanic/teichoic acid biosynthesis glycosyltransferase
MRPVIFGWAQVIYGYAAGVDEMKEKFAYDLYFIKHFSLYLDILIWYKIIETMISGFGARYLIMPIRSANFVEVTL